jgi:RNA polymerase sigma factor (sigma-70 family)
MPGHCTAADLFEEFGIPGRRGREALLRHIQGKTRNEAAALDIEGVLWFRASQHEKGFPGRAPGKSWLYTVANNLAVDYQRACRRDPLALCGLSLDPDRENDDGEWQDGPEPFDPLQSPDKPIIDKEEEERVHALLLRIEPPYRAVLERRAEGQTLAEIAEAMNVSLSTVKARFYRGKIKLLEAMQTIEMEANDGYGKRRICSGNRSTDQSAAACLGAERCAGEETGHETQCRWGSCGRPEAAGPHHRAHAT